MRLIAAGGGARRNRTLRDALKWGWDRLITHPPLHVMPLAQPTALDGFRAALRTPHAHQYGLARLLQRRCGSPVNATGYPSKSSPTDARTRRTTPCRLLPPTDGPAGLTARAYLPDSAPRCVGHHVLIPHAVDNAYHWQDAGGSPVRGAVVGGRVTWRSDNWGCVGDADCPRDGCSEGKNQKCDTSG